VPKAGPIVQPVDPSRAPERAGRLTINSLIHRMTGQVGREETPLRPRAGEAAPAAAPTNEDSERERADIPAFLRRQAN
jgi:hypothetical protein